MADFLKFCDNPVAFFGRGFTAAHCMERDKLEKLQIDAVRHRFAQARQSIPAIKFLSEKSATQEIKALDDLGSVLLPHGIYKSYLEDWLINANFQNMTRWMQNFTTHDLFPLYAHRVETIDAWLEKADEVTPLRISHSSGTTGKLSFSPRSRSETEAALAIQGAHFALAFDPHDVSGQPYDGHLVFLASRYGRSGIARAFDDFEKGLPRPDMLHTLNRNFTSADLQYYFARTNQAVRAGKAPNVEITPYVAAQMSETHQQHRLQGEEFLQMYHLLTNTLVEEKHMICANPPSLMALVKHGEKEGLRRMSPNPNARIMLGGGSKGIELPDDWQDLVREFFGCGITEVYGMTELIATMRNCENGRFHCRPWVVLFAFDPETRTLLPREGVQTGFAAFFDLTARSLWGGMVSSDQVEISWEECGCGQTTAHIKPSITRSLDSEDRSLNCGIEPDIVEELIYRCT